MKWFYAVLLFMLSSQTLASRNILFISIDDMRVDPRAITPNLDALAAQATVYKNAYTIGLYCLPARTTVMFGTSPQTHQVGLNKIFFNEHTPEYQAVYDNPAMLSLPEILSDNGYTTAVTGKVFHTPEPNRWDHNGPAVPWGELVQLQYPNLISRLMNIGVYPAGETHPDQDIANYAINFIQNHSAQAGPFFLGVGFFQPHKPIVPPQTEIDRYNGLGILAHSPTPGDLDDEPALAVDSYTQQLFWAGTPLETSLHQIIVDSGMADDFTIKYLAAISHTDTMIGQVLTALAASPHAATTDVVLWSDHGFQLGEKFRWAKLSYHQPTVRVPFIIKSPTIPAGDVMTPVSLLDLPPTILDLAGIPASPQHEGMSLQAGSSPVEIFHKNGKATIVGDTKLIDYDQSLPGLTDVATYDLATDPEELTNLTPPIGC